MKAASRDIPANGAIPRLSLLKPRAFSSNANCVNMNSIVYGGAPGICRISPTVASVCRSVVMKVTNASGLPCCDDNAADWAATNRGSKPATENRRSEAR